MNRSAVFFNSSSFLKRSLEAHRLAASHARRCPRRQPQPAAGPTCAGTRSPHVQNHCWVWALRHRHLQSLSGHQSVSKQAAKSTASQICNFL